MARIANRGGDPPPRLLRPRQRVSATPAIGFSLTDSTRQEDRSSLFLMLCGSETLLLAADTGLLNVGWPKLGGIALLAAGSGTSPSLSGQIAVATLQRLANRPEIRSPHPSLPTPSASATRLI